MSSSSSSLSDDSSTAVNFSLSSSFSASLSEEKRDGDSNASPTTTLSSWALQNTREKEEEEEEKTQKDAKPNTPPPPHHHHPQKKMTSTISERLKELEMALLAQQKENASLRERVARLEKGGDETTNKEKRDLLELFSTRLSNVKDTLREETKRAMDAAQGANIKLLKLMETLEACETEEGVVLYRNVALGDDEIDRGEEDEGERKKKRFEYVKAALDQIAKEVGYEDALVLAARGESEKRFAATDSAFCTPKRKQYRQWAKLLFAICVRMVQFWIFGWIVIIAAVLVDDMTLRQSASEDFWAKVPWVSKGLVKFVGLASL